MRNRFNNSTWWPQRSLPTHTAHNLCTFNPQRNRNHFEAISPLSSVTAGSGAEGGPLLDTRNVPMRSNFKDLHLEHGKETSGLAHRSNFQKSNRSFYWVKSRNSKIHGRMLGFVLPLHSKSWELPVATVFWCEPAICPCVRNSGRP